MFSHVPPTRPTNVFSEFTRNKLRAWRTKTLTLSQQTCLNLQKKKKKKNNVRYEDFFGIQ